MRVATIDDHPLVLAGIGQILRQAGHEVLAAAPTGQQLVAWLGAEGVDVLTLDIGMPGLNGIEVARQVRTALPHIAVVIVTQQTDKAYLRAALRVGARGFVSKQSAGTELITALTAVRKGRVFISPLVLERTADTRAVLKKALQRQESILSTRQQEVLQLVAAGKAMKEIAQALNISVKTVEFHKRALSEVLGLSTTAELTKYAIAHGHTFLHV